MSEEMEGATAYMVVRVSRKSIQPRVRLFLEFFFFFVHVLMMAMLCVLAMLILFIIIINYLRGS